MHDGQADIDEALVRKLLASQFPDLVPLRVRPVRSAGTVNAIYRIGDHLCARLPLLERYAADTEHEMRWLPHLAPRLTLAIPQPVAKGEPDCGYPFNWAIYRWLDGQPYADDLVEDERQAAVELARFVTELRRTPVAADVPRTGRRPLAELDAATRVSFAEAAQAIDSAAAMAAWEDSLQAPPWDGTPTWIHADLLRPNLLVVGGRLRAVIDFGAVGIGDPASDVIPAWSVFGPAGRQEFRAVLDVDDGTWRRARGIALHQAAALIPYYATTNPGMAALGTRTVEQVVTDFGANRSPVWTAQEGR
jgi:aminoglycoside phosphotransferase (APT) family kinase protein